MGLPKVKGKAETILEIALALALLRPDWKSLLPTQLSTSEVAAQNGSDPYLTKHTTTDSFSALNELTSWDSAGDSVHFSNDLIAMLNTVLGENTESCDESGYSSSNLSPGGSSCGSESLFFDLSSDQQQGLLYEDDSYLGATGYTPPPVEHDKSSVWDLEDFVDLSSLETPPVDKQQWNWPANLQVDFENNDIPYSKSVGLHSKQYPALTSDSEDDLDSKMSTVQEDVLLQPSFYSQDPPDLYSIDFALKSEPTDSDDSGVQFDTLNTDLYMGDFDLPLDILDTRSVNVTCAPPLTSCNSTQPAPAGSVVNTTVHVSSSMPELLTVKVEEEEEELKVEQEELLEQEELPTTDTSVKVKRESRRRAPVEIDLTEDEITELPVTQFNDYVGALPDALANVARDIRRRGKNKEAARICRKRKMDTISTLEEEIALLASKKDLLLKENKLIDDENSDLKQKIGNLYQYVFASLRDENGQPLSPSEHSLLHAANGCLYLVPNNNNTKKSLKVKS